MKFLLDHDVADDLSYLLEQLGHDLTLSSDEAVLQFAYQRGCELLTCNRDDFLHLAATRPTSWDGHCHPPSNSSRGTGCVVSAMPEPALPTRQHARPVWIYALAHFRRVVALAVRQLFIALPAACQLIIIERNAQTRTRA